MPKNNCYKKTPTQEWKKFALVKIYCVAEVQLGFSSVSIICSAEKISQLIKNIIQKISLSFSGYFNRNDTFKKLKKIALIHFGCNYLNFEERNVTY